jgi:ATP-dependent RNA helicase RhlE
MSFDSLGLAPELVRAVAGEGYETPTPIQAQAIPHLLAGRDLLGCAQTGTGKTAAFALPILHRLLTTQPKPIERPEPTGGLSPEGRFHEQTQQHAHMLRAFSRTRHAPRYRRPTRALILSPTRELATQIADSFRTYGRGSRLRDVVIYGGVNQNPQVRLLQQGIDLIIATPGRLLDLTQQGWVDLSTIEMFVLDEADRMLDMGFLPDIRRIISHLPRERQTLLFSATMPGPIQQLAEQILHEPARVTIAPEKVTTELVEQQVYHVAKAQKVDLLTGLLARPEFKRTIVFTQTKHGADRVVKHLDRAGIRAEAIHGNKSQNARQRALGAFKSSQIQVLVATDVAARGIDVDNISHVIQFDLPHEPETYVHRIGRTGRAGQTGLAIAFCDQEQRLELRDIERLISRKIEVMTDHPEGIEPLSFAAPKPQPAGRPGKFRFSGAPRGKKPFGKSRFGKPRDASGYRGDASGYRGDGRSEYPREGVSSDRRPRSLDRSFSERPSQERRGTGRPKSTGKTYGGSGKFKFKAKRRPAAT